MDNNYIYYITYGINVILITALVILAIQLLFYIVIAFFGLKKPVKDYKMREDELKFLFLMPACNEEKVIVESLEALKKLDYRKDLYNVTCLINNSTDKTYEVAKSYTDDVLDIKFTESEAKGKPYVLQKYFNSYDNWKDYDYLVILDADNIAAVDFLKNMNSQILKYGKSNVTVVQGYLGMKNILSSYMAAGYSASYFIANRLVQYAKHNLGLNGNIGGTGFAINSDYIKEKGWNPRTYTEDFELQVELTLQRKVILWNHFAKVYDEKPNTIVAAHRQRVRWSQGHWNVAFKTCFKQLYNLIFKSKNFEQFFNRLEVFLYSYSMSRPPLIILILLLSMFMNIWQSDIPFIFSAIPIWGVIELLNYLIFPVICIFAEGKIVIDDSKTSSGKMGRFFKIYFGYFYSSTTYMVAQIQGLLTCMLPQNSWVKTDHSLDSSHIID